MAEQTPDREALREQIAAAEASLRLIYALAEDGCDDGMDRRDAERARDHLASVLSVVEPLLAERDRLRFFREETERQYQRATEHINAEYTRAEQAEAERDALARQVERLRKWATASEREKNLANTTLDRVRALCDKPSYLRNPHNDTLHPALTVATIRAALSTPEPRTPENGEKP